MSQTALLFVVESIYLDLTTYLLTIIVYFDQACVLYPKSCHKACYQLSNENENQ